MVLSLSLACAAKEDPMATGGGSGDASSAEVADPTVDGEELTHGKVVFELRRSDSQAANPSVGTASVSITMTYRDCLSDFYDTNPALRQTGPEGEPIFGGLDLGGEGWRDRLCAPGLVAAQAECTVASIDQRLDPVAQLTVRYEVTGELENRRLAFGPLPTSETAGCPDPIVRASVGGIKGYDQNGDVVWEAESVEPLDALTDQGGEISVGMAASGD
jgi:hypothetical protein